MTNQAFHNVHFTNRQTRTVLNKNQQWMVDGCSYFVCAFRCQQATLVVVSGGHLGLCIDVGLDCHSLWLLG